MSDAPDLNLVAARLIVFGSRFASTARRHSHESRSIVSLRVLSNLQAFGPMRIGDLAQHEQITQPSMTTAVQRLEQESLVSRSADPADARASVIDITDAGREELRNFRRRAADAILPELQQLTPHEQETLARAAEILQRVTAPVA